jgi:sugar/nucleoside kinase (ribokinase family)
MVVETQGVIGAGEMGDFLLDVAQTHGIGHAGLHRTDAAQTMMTDAYLSQTSGRRTHVLFPGTGPLLTPEHIDPAASTARFLHLGLPGVHAQMDAPWHGDANGWVTVLRKARAAGLHSNMELVTASDAVIRRIVIPCLPWLDTLVVNDSEIAALADQPTREGDRVNPDACLQAARKVLAMGSLELVVVHFPQAAVLAARDGTCLRVPSVAIPKDAQVGPNGAGDAFAAGFFCAFSHAAPLEDALRLAHASAAASLRAADTYSGITRAEDCLIQAQRWGWRELP